jgi:hypothetical protein
MSTNQSLPSETHSLLLQLWLLASSKAPERLLQVSKRKLTYSKKLNYIDEEKLYRKIKV